MGKKVYTFVIHLLLYYFFQRLLIITQIRQKISYIVLLEVKKIKYGEVASYGKIAKMVGNNEAVRAVGTANAKNPLPIIIPCHRIISWNGKLGGYSGGLDKKSFLLDHESNLLHE